MSNFRARLRKAVEIMTLHPGELKYRIAKAISEQLILANVSDDIEIPQHFTQRHANIITQATSNQWNEHASFDKVRATLHGKHMRTLSAIATEIWQLYLDYEDYLRSETIKDSEARYGWRAPR